MVLALPLVSQNVRICDRAEQAGAFWKFCFQPLVPETEEDRTGKVRLKGLNREGGNWTPVKVEIRIET